MKLILKAEVDNLGLPGDVVDVADGYGRNFLLPRGLALPFSRGAMKDAEAITRARKVHESKTLGAAETFREVLEQRAYRVPVRVDESGRLYGSVTSADLQRVLKERGHDIERRRIDLKHAIKALGTYEVGVRVHPQVTATVTVEVVDVEGKVVPGAARAASDDATLEERALAAAEDVEAAAAAEASAAEPPVREDADDSDAAAAAANDESEA